MRALVLALVASVAWAQSTPAPRFRRFTTRTEQGRNTRGLLADSFAFFEFAPASGAGMPAACSSTAPTGAKGEALTFTRTGSATCTRTASGGLATTGIANGDLVTVAGNVARVEYDSQGVLGLRVESSRQNVLLQSGDISNAAYTDVATPTLTGSQTDPFNTSTAVQVSDNDPAALEGRQQTVTVTLAAASVMSCYIKAGTSALAQLTLDGTACNVSGLSSSTWTRAVCVDASASAASVVAQMLVGNAIGDQGTVIYGGCQVEVGGYATSYIPTTTAATTRNAEVPSFSVTGTSQVISMAATLSPEWAFNNAPSSALLSMNGANASTLYNPTATDFRFLSGGVNSSGTTPNAATPWRVFAYADGTTTQASWAGTLATAGAAGAAASRWGTTLGVGEGTPAGVVGAINGIVSRVCVDPSPARCR